MACGRILQGNRMQVDLIKGVMKMNYKIGSPDSIAFTVIHTSGG